jgi:hypothetical protein
VDNKKHVAHTSTPFAHTPAEYRQHYASAAWRPSVATSGEMKILKARPRPLYSPENSGCKSPENHAFLPSFEHLKSGIQSGAITANIRGANMPNSDTWGCRLNFDSKNRATT